MAYRKLNITDFFRFAETEKIIDHEETDLCFASQKINSWMMDNSERIHLKKQLLRVNKLLDLVYSLDFRSDLLNKALNLLNHYKLAVEYQLQLDLLGRRNNGNNDNPYSFVGNNGVNDWDALGLKNKWEEDNNLWEWIKFMFFELFDPIVPSGLVDPDALKSLYNVHKCKKLQKDFENDPDNTPLPGDKKNKK